MESNINYNPTEIRYSHGRLLGQKRQISNKEARSTAVTSPTQAKVKAKMKSGQKLTNEETQVLLDKIKGIQRLRTTQSAKTEFPPKIYPSASDRYLQQQKKLRQIENAARTKSTVYRPLDNTVKGGFERVLEKMHQLGKTKAELTKKSAKMAVLFEKILEFFKKYSKSIKA